MTTEVIDTTTSGLNTAEVESRITRGQVNRVPYGPSRSVGEIVRANVLTRFNFLITVLLVTILIVAPPQDALFGLVMIVNAAIGIWQELEAKRTLDRLTLLTAPTVQVVRDGTVIEVAVTEVVLDDLVMLSPGDQLVVDGTVTESRGLEVDESLLTGEADPVLKQVGDRCLSGSFVVAGTGRYLAEAVGEDAFAVRLAAEARRFTRVRSELREGIDWVLTAITWLLIPTIVLLVWSQLSVDQPLTQGIAGAVAGIVAAVPQGLVLLTSIAFAAGVIRLGRRSVLVRELPAVEGLARVDTVCFDKTGTLTTGRLVLDQVTPLVEDVEADAIGQVLGALAHLDPAPNSTLRAVRQEFDAPPEWTPVATVPFSSTRKWSGATFADQGSFVLGAPEMLVSGDFALSRRVDALAGEGWRVLLLGRVPELPPSDVAPMEVSALALVTLGEEIRPEAGEALEYLASQGVDTKLISGDHPRTVAAIAARVGYPAHDAVDGRRLPDDPRLLAGTLESQSIFGRVTPRQKRMMIASLQRQGHVVAMVGDGVNDVLAVKDADLGLAMGSGSPSLRAVAQVVLLEGDFTTLPDILAEGRRVAANIERVANLFLTKTVYAFLLALAAALFTIVFPFLPRHLTLIGSLTIGIPGFFLALEPNTPRARPGFIGRVLRFAVPTGAVAATATFLAYLLSLDEGVGVVEGRTVATLVLGAVGMMALGMVASPLNNVRRAIVGGVGLGFLFTFLVPFTRRFFALVFPGPVLVLAAIGIIAITGSLFLAGLRASGWVAHMIEPESIAQLPEPVRPMLDSLRQWLTKGRT